MFVDLVNIEVVSGKGGPGCISFHREKYMPRGGPDGGDGGDGGSVFIEVDDNLNTLMDLKYRRKYKAKNGSPGSGNKRSGEKGQNVTVRVPPGTMIYENDTDELICDLVKNNEKFLIAKGGIGGRGNTHFKSPTNQTPRRADTGRPGETKFLRLELKLIADVGLVGYPNAGKSSLLKAMSKASPKIAEYPFTTLTPNIGVVEIKQFMQIRMADIPGIITGASKGKGLGFKFLRHIERTSVLLYMLDGTKEDFLQDLALLQKELEEYNWRLLTKPSVICINKIDLWDSDQINDWQTKRGDEYLFISAKEQIGLESIKNRLMDIEQAKQESENEE